jgi:anti-sigma regulatory factor (Ser/Thr protein kinase)
VIDAELTATPQQHQVFFYDEDHELVASVARYVTEGLSVGEPAIVIATAAHLAALDEALHDHGIDAPLARATGDYLAFDAAETLDSFMVDGSPDDDRFMKVIGGMLASTRRVGADIRAFGEMVALLWHQDNVSGAIALESLWNDLADRQPFSLLCAYPTTALTTAGLGDVHEVCRLHSDVLPPSSYGSRAPSGDEDAAAVRSDVFVALPDAVVAARRFVRGALTSWGEGHLVGDGELIVSELATNAVIHGGSPFRASIEWSPRVVRIAVEDAGPGFPHSHLASHDAPSGRGVAIVEALSSRWGCDRVDGGKVSWAELETAAAQQA